MSRIGVTVVTGAIGSGKTTLIRRMCLAAPELRVCLIECRFGVEIGCPSVEDLPNVVHLEAFETLEHLCLCCNPREELQEALEKTWMLSHLFDHVIVETTGLAEPAWLGMFLRGRLSERFEVRSVVCVVDCDLWEQQRIKCFNRSIEEEQVALCSALYLAQKNALQPRSNEDKVVPELLSLMQSYQGVLAESGSADDVIVRSRDDTDDTVRKVFFASSSKPLWNGFKANVSPDDYFNLATPTWRHQKYWECGSLIGVVALSEEHSDAVLRWVRSIAPRWLRCKGVLFLSDSLTRIELDGTAGVLSCTVAGMWNPETEIPATKLSFVGTKVQSFSLRDELKAYTKGAVELQPTVLYSSPPPHVDTKLQRAVLLLVGAVIALLPGVERWRLWIYLALCIYTYLSFIR